MHKMKQPVTEPPIACIEFLSKEYHALSSIEIEQLSNEEKIQHSQIGTHYRYIEQDMAMMYSHSETQGKSIYSLPVAKHQTIFLFNLSGKIELEYGNNTISLNENTGITCCPLVDSFKLDWHSTDKTEFLLVSLPLTKLHTLFETNVQSSDSDNKAMTDSDLIQKEFEISPSISSCIHQIRTYNGSQNAANLYFKGKVLESIALCMQEIERKTQAESACPVISTHDEWQKVHRAKDILQEEWDTPPSAQELAYQVGLNEYKLKAGFKYMYGTTIFNFLKEYKLEKAKEWLISENARVNEVATRIGYTNISHFIAAFKNRFGITPKQFLLSKQRNGA